MSACRDGGDGSSSCDECPLKENALWPIILFSIYEHIRSLLQLILNEACCYFPLNFGVQCGGILCPSNIFAMCTWTKNHFRKI
jgi:hypothetical protein